MNYSEKMKCVRSYNFKKSERFTKEKCGQKSHILEAFVTIAHLLQTKIYKICMNIVFLCFAARHCKKM